MRYERGGGDYGVNSRIWRDVYPKWAKTPCRDAAPHVSKRAMWAGNNETGYCRLNRYAGIEITAISIQGDRINYMSH
jgi:hypothetical protein